MSKNKPIHGGYPTPDKRGFIKMYKDATICDTCGEKIEVTYPNGWAHKCTNRDCGVTIGSGRHIQTNFGATK